MRKVSTQVRISNELLGSFQYDVKNDIIEYDIINSLSKHIVSEKLVDIKKEKIDKIDGDTYSTEFYILKPEEIREIIVCLKDIKRNSIINDRIYNRASEIQSVLIPDDEK